MPKKKTPGRPPKSAELERALEVFGRAERLFPRLLAQRDQLARELARVEEALARLKPVAGASNASPKAAVVTEPKARPGRKGAPGTLASLLLDVLGQAKGPLGAADLTKLVRKKSPNAGIAGLQKALRELRDRGQVHTTGKAKRFQYTLGKGGAPTAAKSPKATPAKRGPKPGGGPSVHKILVGALGGGKSLGMKDLVGVATSKRNDIKPNSVETIIHKLRRDGVLKASGAAGSYKFSLP